MGNQCTCVPEPDHQTKPHNAFSSHSGSHLESDQNIHSALTALPNLRDELEVKIEQRTPVFGTFQKRQNAMKAWSRLQTNDGEPLSHKDESIDLLKKSASFFRFSSLESRYQASPIEYASNLHGNSWKLQNMKLMSIIKKSPGRYLWEAENMATEKKCAVKVSLIESSRLQHNNFSGPEAILKDLADLQNPNVIDVYSFSIFESEFHSKPCVAIVILQELSKCSLRDVHTFRADKKVLWSQNELLIIMRDIYSGLLACKKKQLVHGRLSLENILISEGTGNIIIGDFAMKLPIGSDLDNSPPPRYSLSRFGEKSLPTLQDAQKGLNAPDEKDIYNLTLIILKLLTNDENIGFSYSMLRKDERYKKGHSKVFEALDMITDIKKAPMEILRDITEFIEKDHDKVLTDLPSGFNSGYQQESYVDLLFSKIDCYELLNQHNTSLEVYSELIRILESKDEKNTKEYQAYLKCINKTIKHYVAASDWLKAKEISSELNSFLKKNEVLKKMLKSFPKEYINFIFLLGNINEGLGESEKALMLYTKGLSYSKDHNLELEAYPSVLKRMSNLHLKKRDDKQALDYLKRLLNHYEAQEGYYVDKADGYLNMGDIIIKQGDLGHGVKFYVKAFENLKKGKFNTKEALLNAVEKIIETYITLHEDAKALTYMFESLVLVEEIFGKKSGQYMEEIGRIAALQEKMGNYEGALGNYLLFEELITKEESNTYEYAEILISIGNTYSELVQYEKARICFEKSTSIQEKLNGKNNKGFLKAQDGLANILFKERKLKECLEVQLNAFEIKEKLFEMDDIYIVLSLTNIGDTYFASRRYPEALDFHRKALDNLEARQKEFKKEYSQLLIKIALDYDKDGNSGQAVNCVYQSFKITNGQELELEMKNTIDTYELLSRAREIKVKSLNFEKLILQTEY